MDDLKVQTKETLEEVKERIKKEIKEQKKKPKVVRVSMRYKDYRKIKRDEAQMKRRAEDYILQSDAHEERRKKAELRRRIKNNKRKR